MDQGQGPEQVKLQLCEKVEILFYDLATLALAQLADTATITTHWLLVPATVAVYSTRLAWNGRGRSGLNVWGWEMCSSWGKDRR
jgi:hypothetical protein